MDVEGPLPLGIKGGIVGNMVTSVGLPLMGCKITMEFVAVLGSLAAIVVAM